MRRTWTSKWKPGQKAPSFTALLQNGKEISYTSLLGRRYILFFYNHNGSETCTKEVCNMRDHYSLLTHLGFTLYGVSEDSARSHQNFISKLKLPFNLVSDTDNKLAKIFDVYGEKEFMGRVSDAVHRTTFVISTQGKFEAIVHPVDSANHCAQILDELKLM